MPAISIVMDSKLYKANVQPVSVEKYDIYHRKEDDSKFSVLRKTGF